MTARTSESGPADAAAFEREAIPYLEALHRAAQRIVRGEQAAEDLVQDTLERAFKNYHRFERGTNMRAWLFKIMTFVAISGYRRQRAAPEQASIDELDDYNLYRQARLDGVPPRDVESLVLDRIGEAAVRDAVDRLPDQYRAVVVLCDVEGFAYREIANILEIPQGTVMSRLFRGRKQLQRLLWDYAKSAGYVSDARLAELAQRG